MIAVKLIWNQKESVFDLLDLVLQDTADASYLNEDGGILVTICVSDPHVYEDLENKIGRSIDRKLDEMEIPDVITAFQQGTEDLLEDGRTHLETELADQYGADLAQIQQMSVVDLIRYCRKNTSLDLKLSPHSDQRWNEISEQKKEALNERNEIENDVENEMSQKTEEADVNSESKDVQDVPEEDTENAVSENKTLKDNAEETDFGTKVLPEDAPASSEVPDSSPTIHETDQDQSDGNGEGRKDDGDQKKNKKEKKKKDKKKTKDKDNKKKKNKDNKDKDKKDKDNKDKKKKDTDSSKKKEDTKKRNTDGTSDTKNKQDKKTKNDKDKLKDENKSDGPEKKEDDKTGKKSKK